MFEVAETGRSEYKIAKQIVTVEWHRQDNEFASRIVKDGSNMWVFLETNKGVYTLTYYSGRELIGVRRYAGSGYREGVLAGIPDMKGWEEYSPLLELGRGPITELYGRFGQFLCESAYKLGY